MPRRTISEQRRIEASGGAEEKSERKIRNVISVRGARVNNLKGIDVDLPRDQLVVVTGLSGSGKSSLAFDTIHAEANRRYMESVSSYARHFMESFERPDADRISNLSPSISIDQKSIVRSPRSTVGTMTEVYDYLRVLFAKAGEPYCSSCGHRLERRDARDILREILDLPDGSRAIFLTRMERNARKTEQEALRVIIAAGYVRVRFHDQILSAVEALPHASDMLLSEMETVIDRIVINQKKPDTERILDSIETSFRLGHGTMTLLIDDREERRYSREYLCPTCGTGIADLVPQLFSFNNPEGACRTCSGLGSRLEVDLDLVVPNRNLSIPEGAIRPWNRSSCTFGIANEDEDESEESSQNETKSSKKGVFGGFELLRTFAKRRGIRLDVPVAKLSKSDFREIFHGERIVEGEEKRGLYPFPGIIPLLERKYRETKSDHVRSAIERFTVASICPDCRGKRLRPESLAVRFNGQGIDVIADMTVSRARKYFAELAKPIEDGGDRTVSPLAAEIVERLAAVAGIGLGYLSLSRSAETLSGGEAQRLKLATQMKSALSGVLYVLDEPSIGLHNRDTDRLIGALRELRSRGNSLIVVEHDPAVMKAADWIVDLGPGAGREGGELLFSGTPAKLLASRHATGAYLSGRRAVSEKRAVRKSSRFLTVIGATEHNLKNVTVDFPLGTFTVVSGVSGSGKSTLVTDILSRALLRKFFGAREAPGEYRTLRGVEWIDKVIVIDQNPIGRTPRSNAATYTGAWSPIRDLFATTAEAEKAGFAPSHFSFNMRGGRCETCQGSGSRKVEMYLLPDMYVPCETCGGARYNDRALAIEYRGMTIAQVLGMTVTEARAFFFDRPVIEEKLRALDEVGLGYLVLGQSATNLSGGEAQRVKLATELARKATGRTLYILDEPTIGLHFEDVRKLLAILDVLVGKGNTVIVIEHNSDVIRHADWVVDMGPEGGEAGGEVVFTGVPSALRRCRKSLTGKYL